MLSAVRALGAVAGNPHRAVADNVKGEIFSPITPSVGGRIKLDFLLSPAGWFKGENSLWPA